MAQKRYGMVIDLKRCVGCQSCTVACKAEQGTPPGVFFTRVLEREVGTFPSARRHFIPVLCNHCQDAPCEKACPTGATYRREDGIVLVDENKCIGCRTCYVSCPYNNRFYLYKGDLHRGYYGRTLTPFEKLKYANYQEGTTVKCTLCAHRIDQGLEPACVITCPSSARIFGDLNDPDSEVSHILARRSGKPFHPEYNTDPSVFYVEG